MRALLVLASLAGLVHEAQAEVLNVKLSCPNGMEINRTVDCEVDKTYIVTGTCPGGGTVRKSATCFANPFVVGDWGVGIGGVVLDATSGGGPSPAGVEVSFVGNLRVAPNWLYLHGEASVGTLYNGVNWYPELADFVGVELRLIDWLAVDLGARHRVVFYADGDKINFVGAALQARVKAFWGITFVAGAEYGKAWFPVTSTSSSWDSTTKYTTETSATRVDYGPAFAVTLSAAYNFF